MDSEIWTDILFGLVAITIPVALYIAYLDLKDWRHDRRKLMVSRSTTRVGWCLTVGAIAIRAVRHYPVVEHGPAWLYAIFVLGVLLSCVGMLGVARIYHEENDTSSRNYERDEDEREGN